MDMTTRKIGRHIETEPDWEASFTLQFRVTPVISLVWDWCASDVSWGSAYIECFTAMIFLTIVLLFIYGSNFK